MVTVVLFQESTSVTTRCCDEGCREWPLATGLPPLPWLLAPDHVIVRPLTVAARHLSPDRRGCGPSGPCGPWLRLWLVVTAPMEGRAHTRSTTGTALTTAISVPYTCLSAPARNAAAPQAPRAPQRSQARIDAFRLRPGRPRAPRAPDTSEPRIDAFRLRLGTLLHHRHRVHHSDLSPVYMPFWSRRGRPHAPQAPRAPHTPEPHIDSCRGPATIRAGGGSWRCGR